MTDRELYKQVLNEYLVFSDKSPADFVEALEICALTKPTLIRYLKTCVEYNPNCALSIINLYWSQYSLEILLEELRGIYREWTLSWRVSYRIVRRI